MEKATVPREYHNSDFFSGSTFKSYYNEILNHKKSLRGHDHCNCKQTCFSFPILTVNRYGSGPRGSLIYLFIYFHLAACHVAEIVMENSAGMLLYQRWLFQTQGMRGVTQYAKLFPWSVPRHAVTQWITQRRPCLRTSSDPRHPQSTTGHCGEASVLEWRGRPKCSMMPSFRQCWPWCHTEDTQPPSSHSLGLPQAEVSCCFSSEKNVI